MKKQIGLLKYFMKKDKQIKDFDVSLQEYFSEKEPSLHKKAIRELLREADLEDSFDELASKGNGVEKFFLMWETAGKAEKNSPDKEGLQRLGKLSKEFYGKKEYKKLYELFFDIMFNDFARYANLRNRKDFEKITDRDLYEKNIVPSEIFLQYFLMESPIKSGGFDWNRSEEIMKQNLACLVICFGDIYEFFHEEDF